MMNIGDIVTLKNHPFNSEKDWQNIYVSGDNSLIPPTMVIGEILYSDYKHEKVKQVLAYYFDHKDGKFKNNWFYEKQIKLIETKSKTSFINLNDDDETEKKIIEAKHNAHTFILLNTDLELHKKRINRQEEANGFVKETIDNYYTFLPPVLTFIDYQKLDEKKLHPNKKQGIYFVKCKWYNAKDGKFSEDLLPACILEHVNISLNTRIFDKLQNDDKDLIKKNYYHLKDYKKYNITDGAFEVKPILEFKRLRFLHYKYYVDFVNIFNKENITIEFNQLNFNVENILTYGELFEGEAIKKYSDKQIKKEDIKEQMFYFIEYINLRNVKTHRIIYVESIVDGNLSESNNENNFFVNAKCLLKNGAERTFNSDRILKITKLNKKYFN